MSMSYSSSDLSFESKTRQKKLQCNAQRLSPNAIFSQLIRYVKDDI